jgi:dTDP-glucose 4,6-dehydratase
MEKKTKLLLTGGMGFTGHHFVEGILKNTDWDIVVLDRLDISGNPNRLTDISIWEKEKHRVKFVWWDLKAPINEYVEKEIGEVDYIFHLAGSTHVDRSIEDPLSFVMDNVVGGCNILNYARKLKGLRLMIAMITDEIFGPAPEGVNFKEEDRHNPKNPYAATKCGLDALCVAFHNTYKLPVIWRKTASRKVYSFYYQKGFAWRKGCNPR